MWALSGALSSRILGLIRKFRPISRLTCVLYFVVFSQMSLLMFGVFDRHRIYVCIPVVSVILLAASVGADYYRATRKTKQ